jgi:ketosteroid isomerase-like protein
VTTGDKIETIRALLPQEVEMVGMVGDTALFATLAGLIAPDVEVTFVASAPGVPTLNFRGLEGFREGWSDWLEPYESYRVETDEVLDAGGDDVLVRVRVRARTRRDQVAIEHTPAALCTVEDGKITRIAFYLDADQAMEAAGLADTPPR